MLGEGFEAALVVAIVYAYIRRIGRRDLVGPMWQGMAAAAALSVGAGITVHPTVENLTGEPRLLAGDRRARRRARGSASGATGTAGPWRRAMGVGWWLIVVAYRWRTMLCRNAGAALQATGDPTILQPNGCT
jgi:iron permease FTR1 family protein